MKKGVYVHDRAAGWRKGVKLGGWETGEILVRQRFRMQEISEN